MTDEPKTMGARALLTAVNKANAVYIRFDPEPSNDEGETICLRIEKVAIRDLVEEIRERDIEVEAEIDGEGDLIISPLDDGEDDDRTWEVDGESYDGGLYGFLDEHEDLPEPTVDALEALEPGRAMKVKTGGGDAYVVKRLT